MSSPQPAWRREVVPAFETDRSAFQAGGTAYEAGCVAETRRDVGLPKWKRKERMAPAGYTMARAATLHRNQG